MNKKFSCFINKIQTDVREFIIASFYAIGIIVGWVIVGTLCYKILSIFDTIWILFRSIGFICDIYVF